MFFHSTPWLVQHISPSLTWRRKTADKELFLTFDDGPIPELTPYVLEILEQFSIKATFFCVGDNLRKHRSIAEEALQAGHRLGNHTYHHLNGWKTDNEIYFNNVSECQDQLEALETNTRLFRPPYGRLRRSQIGSIRLNYEIIMWDVLSGDFSTKITSQNCLANTINATRPGSIVLFHDNIKAEKNLKYALPRYVEDCLSKGYSFSVL